MCSVPQEKEKKKKKIERIIINTITCCQASINKVVIKSFMLVRNILQIFYIEFCGKCSESLESSSCDIKIYYHCIVHED